MFNFYDKIYCINLDTRVDRWQDVQKEFQKINLENVTRISGVNLKENPAFGCALSHAFCIQDAIDNNLEKILILEDDVLFLDNFLQVFPQAISELENLDWSLFYLGANLERPCYQETPHLSKLTFAFSTHAISLHKNIFQKALEINKNKSILHNDIAYTDIIISSNPCYICSPMVAIQRPTYSDIEKRYVDYSWMIQRFNNNWVKKNG